MEERYYWLGFSVFPGIGPKRFAQLLAYFKTAEAAWRAGEKELENSGLGKVTSGKFLRFKKDFSLDTYLEQLEKKHVSFSILTDEKYPKLLKQTGNPPFVLYVRGKIDFNPSTGSGQVRTIGIVGTRKITSYGREVTEFLTRDLVANGFCIVSGLALGVDALSHETAIENDGKTVAVLGCGVDVCYPSSNQKVYDSILNGHGAIVSEYPLGATPSVGSFPSRNRIIAGLSEAVVVTEGAADSGALITASNAASLQRQIFAVPGQITSSLAKGPLSLIQKGAKLITSAEDILDGLGLQRDKRDKGDKKIKGETPEEQKILDLLKAEPMHVNDIGKQTGIDFSILSSVLSLMELKGFIKSEDDGKYALTH